MIISNGNWFEVTEVAFSLLWTQAHQVGSRGSYCVEINFTLNLDPKQQSHLAKAMGSGVLKHYTIVLHKEKIAHRDLQIIIVVHLGSKFLSVEWGSEQNVQPYMQHALMTTLTFNECNHSSKGWKQKAQSNMLCVSRPHAQFCGGTVQRRSVLLLMGLL